MSPDQVSNYFTLSAEIIVGFLAFQGIATTFVFGQKGHWSYVDLWLFTWLILNNVCAIASCLLPVFLLINGDPDEAFWRLNFHVLFFWLLGCAIFFIYTQYKIQERQKMDAATQQELDSTANHALQWTFYILMFIPFALPVAHYLEVIGPTFIRNWVCLAPWLWNIGTFGNFFLLIHNALRVED